LKISFGNLLIKKESWFRLDGLTVSDPKVAMEIYAIYLFETIQDKQLFYDEISAILRFCEHSFDFFEVQIRLTGS